VQLLSADFLPRIVGQRLLQIGDSLSRPRADHYKAVLLFLDIAGFTALADHLAERPSGSEELSQLLNAFFDEMIAVISRRGGDVFSLEGDALLALWPLGECDASADILALQAAACGLEIQRHLAGRSFLNSVQLTVRVSIGYGQIMVMHLGDHSAGWHLVITGEGCDQINRADAVTQPGDVIVSPEGWTILSREAVGTELSGGNVRIGKVAEVAPLTSSPSELKTTLPKNEAQRAVMGYVPAILRQRLAPEEAAWIGEVRPISVVFVNLPDLDHRTPDALERAQAAVNTVNQVLGQYEGDLNKVSIDQKGISLLAAFGLPSATYGEGPLRAIRAAQAIQKSLKATGISPNIGVSTGRVFCGIIGNQLRREYTIVGSVVNLAARLMQAAPGDVLCDEATARAAGTRIKFGPLPPISLKGKSELIRAYRPLGSAEEPSQRGVLVGRLPETAAIKEKLRLLGTGVSGLLLVEGEPGIGKSHLISVVHQSALDMGINVLLGRTDAVDQQSPYYAWRSIVTRILNLEGFSHLETKRAKMMEFLAKYPEWIERAPLLNGFLDLGLPDNELTAQMSGQVRSDNIREMVLHLIRVYATTKPCAFVMEDAHWLDSASWNLIQAMVQRVEPLLTILVSRPYTDGAPSVWVELRQRPEAQTISLGPLAKDELEEVIAQRLSTHSVPVVLTDFILEHSHGNPFFAEQLTYALRDSNVVRTEEDRCELTSTPQHALWPSSVHGVIVSRIGRLDAAGQLALKVASVIGRVFAFDLVHDIFPVQTDRPYLQGHAERLCQLDLTVLYATDPETEYMFKHVITRDVAYDLLLLAQRKELHREVAQWYETTRTANLSSFYPLLAYHWSAAGAIDKSLDYLDRAGEAALRDGAYKEAAHFMAEALRLLEDNASEHWQPRRARWECNLGEALYGTGRMDESRRHLNIALDLLGQPVASSVKQQIFQLLGEVCRQAKSRLIKETPIAPPDQREAFMYASRAYGFLGMMSYLTSDAIGVTYSSLRMMNLSESVGPSFELVEGTSLVAVCAGLIPLIGLAEFYASRALTAGDVAGTSSARALALGYTAVFYVGLGRWKLLRKNLTESMALFDRLGNNRRWTESSCLLSSVMHYEGDFTGRLRLAAEIHARARVKGDAQSQVWGLLDQVESLIPLGRIDEAVRLIEEVKTTLGHGIGKSDRIWLYGLEAVAQWRNGNVEEARQAVDNGLALVSEVRPTAVYTMEGCAGLAQTAVDLFEQSRDEAAHSRVRTACRALKQFAGPMPIAEPRLNLIRGNYESILGRDEKALRLWRKSLECGNGLGMAYEQALAHRQIATHSKGADREFHQNAADRLFSGCQIPQYQQHPETRADSLPYV
jgi:class 3 adenylate cyclase/tetratricopeptide (TPR) repeat protein